MIGGALAMALVVARLLRNERRAARLRQTERQSARSGRSGSKMRKDTMTLWIILALVVAAGAFLRLNDLNEKTISHPEVYVPGISLPADISEPPARDRLVPLVWFHFHGEPHPPAYYFMMYGWTKVFGAGLLALRLPSVLFGIFSILFAFLVGRQLFDMHVGVLSAALVAFNGHQIYWSQHARMYAMTCFLGLLAIFFLVKTLRERDKVRQVGWGAAYVATACLGVYTEILFWVLLAGQMLFTLGRQNIRVSSEPTSGIVFRLQSLVVMLGAPMWAHAVYTGRSSPLEPVTLTFIGEFLSFGFLFERDFFSLPERAMAGSVLALLTVFALACAAFAFRRCKKRARDFPLDKSPLTAFQLRPVALLSVATVIGFSLVARHDRELLLLTCLVPIAALFLPDVAVRVWKYYRKTFRLFCLIDFARDSRFLLVALSILPLGLVVFISLFNSLLASRLFLIFVPYLLILIAAGVINLARRSVVFIPAAILIVFLHAASVNYYRHYPTEMLDYSNLAGKMTAAAEVGDTVFVHRRSWITTPVFYHLDSRKFDFAAHDFDLSAADKNVRRIWLVDFEGQAPGPEMLEALSGFEPILTVDARRSKAVLYRRRDSRAIISE